ncbi:MAG: cytochrome oxidase putative small subunit CydP [Zoogloea sp.]|uniref:cytochrome oxidase putative small subunit CydP n=1 Tax=Zoogloea sp. TaxID=49181 RepID=UPI003F3A5C3F
MQRTRFAFLRSRLSREIAAALVLKLCLVAVLKALFFSAPLERVDVASRLESRLTNHPPGSRAEVRPAAPSTLLTEHP